MALISIPTRGQARSYDRETQAALQQVANILNSRYRGSITFSGTETSNVVLFREIGLMDQADTSYHVFTTKIGITGTPVKESLIFKLADLYTEGITFNIYSAPGTGNSVTYAWKMFNSKPVAKSFLCNANIGAPGDATTTGSGIVNVPPLSASAGLSRDRDVRSTLERIKSVLDNDYVGEITQTDTSHTYYFSDFDLPDQQDSNYDIFLIALWLYVEIPPDDVWIVKSIATYTDRFVVTWVDKPTAAGYVTWRWKLFRWL